MITQKELRQVQAARQKVADLAQSPAVLEYEAAQRTAAEKLDIIRKRFEAGEEVETGKLICKRTVKQSVRVVWEKVLIAFKSVPAIAKVAAKDTAAKELLGLVDARSAASPYVSTANSVSFDIVPAGG